MSKDYKRKTFLLTDIAEATDTNLLEYDRISKYKDLKIEFEKYLAPQISNRANNHCR